MKSTIVLDSWFDSYKEISGDITIDELLDKHHNDVSARIENHIYDGVGWSVHSILHNPLFISEIDPCEESLYLLLLKELNNSMKGLINIQNDNNECFRWCLVRYLNPVDKNPIIIRNIYREFTNQLNFKA